LHCLQGRLTFENLCYRIVHRWSTTSRDGLGKHGQLDWKFYSWYDISKSSGPNWCLLLCAFCCVHYAVGTLAMVEAARDVGRGAYRPNRSRAVENHQWRCTRFQKLISDSYEGEILCTFIAQRYLHLSLVPVGKYLNVVQYIARRYSLVVTCATLRVSQLGNI
jgi:hypothetical protein